MNFLSQSHSHDIASRYVEVVDKINHSARAAGRNPDEIQLVVVTKGQPVEKILQVVEAGARILGENYVQEALHKNNHPGLLKDISWHMIGHIQSRKARQVCENFAYVHSLDSEKLAHRLSVSCQDLNKTIPVLLECNVSGERSKFGWDAVNEAMWKNLVLPIQRISSLPGIVINGLMTMPPFFDDPDKARPLFQKLSRLREYIRSEIPGLLLPHLSMGMSGDYEVAVEEGATMVRIGTAIMGSRITYE